MRQRHAPFIRFLSTLGGFMIGGAMALGATISIRRHWLADAQDIFCAVSTVILVWLVYLIFTITLYSKGKLTDQVADSVPFIEGWPTVVVTAEPIHAGERLEIERAFAVNSNQQRIFFLIEWCVVLIPFIPALSLFQTPTLWSFWSLAFTGTCFLFALQAALQNYKGRKPQRIYADDEGITVQYGKQCPRSMRWEAIVGVVCLKHDARPEQGHYAIFGRDRRHIEIYPLSSALSSRSLARSSVIAYSGGYEAYSVDFKRLLATISARSGIAIYTHKVPQPKTPIPLTAEAALDLPLAPADMQPQSAILSDLGLALIPNPPAWVGDERKSYDFETTNGPLICDPTPALSNMVIHASLMALAFTAIWVGIIWSALDYSLAPITDLGHPLWSFIGLSFGIIFPVAFLLRRAIYRQRYPIIIAGDDGIERLTLPRQPPAVTPIVPFEKIRAWVVEVQRGGNRRYTIYAEDDILSWTERDGARLAGRNVRGDRRAAYRQRTEQLHALIARRTGLALRLIPDRVNPLT
jgi:hypothetical protein